MPQQTNAHYLTLLIALSASGNGKKNKQFSSSNCPNGQMRQEELKHDEERIRDMDNVGRTRRV